MQAQGQTSALYRTDTFAGSFSVGEKIGLALAVLCPVNALTSSAAGIIIAGGMRLDAAASSIATNSYSSGCLSLVDAFAIAGCVNWSVKT